MLRITVHRNSQSITFQLEGRLSRSWLQELDKCWRRTLICKDKPAVRVDLTGLTFVDDAGKACLAAMHHDGADFEKWADSVEAFLDNSVDYDWNSES